MWQTEWKILLNNLPQRKICLKKRFLGIFKSRYSKNFIGNKSLHGCLQTHVFSVLSRPHPPPHSNCSCKARISFLDEPQVQGHSKAKNTSQLFCFVWGTKSLFTPCPQICLFDAKIRNQGMVKLANSRDHSLDRIARCLGCSWDTVQQAN